MCYNNHEVYDAIVDSIFNYIIKGERPKYDHLYIAFDFDKLNLGKIIDDKYDDGYNLSEIICGNYGVSVPIWDFKINNTITIGQCCNDKEDKKDFENELKIFKRIYTAAQKIFDAAKVSDKYDVYDNDVDKLISLTNYLYAHETSSDYAISQSDIVLERYVIYGGGTCHEHCEGFMYLCSLLRIPCYDITGLRFTTSHGWNVVKLNGKWYCYEPQDPIYMKTIQGKSLWGRKDWFTIFTVDDRNNNIVRHIYKNLADYGIPFTEEYVTSVVTRSGQALECYSI